MWKAGGSRSQGDSDAAFLNERELARRWGTSPRTLQRWRAERYGPAFIRIGGGVRYRLSDILAYEEQHRETGGVR